MPTETAETGYTVRVFEDIDRNQQVMVEVIGEVVRVSLRDNGEHRSWGPPLQDVTGYER